MSKPVLYKVNDLCNCLVIGATYIARKDGRMVAFTNEKTGVVVHIYEHEIVHAIARNALQIVNETTGEKWQCKLCDTLCHHTENGIAY